MPFDFLAANGVPFRVRIVRTGDRYGLNGCLTHEDVRPMVEFFDRRYMHTVNGQFVQRYYCETLRGECTQGLLLNGAEPSWSVDAASLREVQAYLRGALGE